MALNKEIWVKQIKENFYPDRSFLSKVSDYTAHVDNNKIHIPSSGIDPEVLINNTTYPIAVVGRDDFDNSISLDRFETENTIVRRPETIEYSYDKLESVIKQHRDTLQKTTAMKAAHAFAPTEDTAKTPVLKTTGAVLNGRLQFSFNDILAMKERFDDAQIPDNDRYFVLNPKHVSDLLREDKELFKELTNIKDGHPFKFAGFGFFSFGFTPYYQEVDGVITKNPYNSISGLFSSIAYQAGEVMKADGDIHMYSVYDDPKERGTIVGFDKRFIALPIRGIGIGSVVSSPA